MIIDSLYNLEAYQKLIPQLKTIKSWIQTGVDLFESGFSLDLPEGMNVIFSETKSLGLPLLEAHQRYIDVHIIIEGKDVSGYRFVEHCQQPKGTYKKEEDYILYRDPYSQTVSLEKHDFAVFFPNDAHAPLTGNHYCKKMVFKIPVNHDK